MNILFYDVETANSKPGSICSVGWVLMDAFGKKDEGYSLINADTDFSSVNTRIHGITRDMVADAPSFAEYWKSTLSPLFEKSVIVAHNAVFDMTSTMQALLGAGIPLPSIDYIDSLQITRRYISSDHHNLSVLADLIGYRYREHHALEDVKALIAVLDSIRQTIGLDDIPDLLLHGLSASTTEIVPSKEEKKPFVPMRPTDPRPEKPAELLDEKLKGLKICVTGDIPGFDRTGIEEMILLHGGQAMRGVSKKTDYLVVGTYPDFGPDFISSKQKKAMEVIAEGGKVKIISPEEFMKMME